MKTTFLFLFLCLSVAFSQTHVIVSSQSLLGDAKRNLPVTLQWASSAPPVTSSNVVSTAPITYRTDVNGNTTFSNVVSGYYNLKLEDRLGVTTYLLYVPTNAATYYAHQIQTNALSFGAPSWWGSGGTNGTTYTNTTATVGVISGSGLGTNTSHLVGTNYTGSLWLNGRRIYDETNYGATAIEGTLLVTDQLVSSLLEVNNITLSGVTRSTWPEGDIRADSSNNMVSAWTSADAGKLNRQNGEFGLLGLVFNGGEAWPPTEENQKARAVFSTDGKTWSGGTGFPLFSGVGGEVRDPSLIRVGELYAVAYTTNAPNQTTGIFPFGTAFGLRTSTNLLHWSAQTNISMLLSGESANSNRVWSPVLFQSGSNIYAYASVTTNGTTYEQRFTKTSTNNFPHGWSAVAQMSNSTGRTNIIDLTPYYDAPSGNWYGVFKNESTKYIEIGQFASGVESAFSLVLSNDHSNWGGNVEGNWFVQLPNGRYRVFMCRYQGKDYGNRGQGETLCFAESASITSGWSTLTNCNTPFYMQSFKPLLLTNLADINAAQSVVHAGLFPLKGRVNILPELGGGAQGLYGYGYTFTNPYPNAYTDGVLTNDFAGFNFGAGNWGSGVYGKGDGSVRLYARTWSSADSNAMIRANAKDVLIAQSNRVDISVPLYVQGTLLTNGGSGSLVSNYVALATGTFDATNVVLLRSNVTITGGSLIASNAIGAGYPYVELYSYSTATNANGALIGFGNKLLPHQWSIFNQPHITNSFAIGLMGGTWDRYLTILTNGTVGLGPNNYNYGATLDVKTNTAAAGGNGVAARFRGNVTVDGTITGNGSGITNLNGTVAYAASGANTFTNGIITLNTNGFGGGGGSASSMTYNVSIYTPLLVGPAVNTFDSSLQIAGPRYTSTYQWAAFPLLAPNGYTTNIVKAVFVVTNGSTYNVDFITRYYTNGIAVDTTTNPNTVSRTMTGSGNTTNTVTVSATNTTGTAWSGVDAANLKLSSGATFPASAWLIGLEQTLMK